MRLLYTILGTLSSLIIGAVWTYFRWKEIVRQEAMYYRIQRHNFLLMNGYRGVTVPEPLLALWKAFCAKDPRLKNLPPEPSQYKMQMLLLLIFWPISMLIIGVRYINTKLTHQSSKVLGKVAESQFEDVRQELK